MPDVIMHTISIVIRDGCPFSLFPAHLHLQIHMPTSSLSSYLAASAKSAVTLFRQIVTEGNYLANVGMFMALSGNTCMGRPKIAHGSHNDVRRLCWPNLGCESPLVENPKSSVCWEKKVAPSGFCCGQAIAVNRGKQR